MSGKESSALRLRTAGAITMLLALLIGLVISPVASSAAPVTYNPNYTCQVPFIAQGSSSTVAGVTVTATVNSAVRGDTSNTYLFQSNSRIKTVLTFSPPVPSIRITTRNHADAAAGFETLTFTGAVTESPNSFTTVITDSDTTVTYTTASTSNFNGMLSSLTIDYTFDTPVPDFARGSYVDLRLSCVDLTPSTQTVTGGQGTAITSTASLVQTGFYGEISYAVTAGTLPAGLTLDTATGVISGTPLLGSSSSVTITGTGSTFGTDTAVVNFAITGPTTWTLDVSPTNVTASDGKAVYTTDAPDGTVFAHILQSDNSVLSTGTVMNGEFELAWNTVNPTTEDVAITTRLYPSGTSSITSATAFISETNTTFVQGAPVPDVMPSQPLVTITLSGNSGTCNSSSVSGPRGSWVALPGVNDCTNSGLILSGWRDRDGVKTFPPGSSVNLFSDNTLFAVWRSDNTQSTVREPDESVSSTSVYVVKWRVGQARTPEFITGIRADLRMYPSVFTLNGTNQDLVTPKAVAQTKALADLYGGVYGGFVQSNSWIKPRIVAAYRK